MKESIKSIIEWHETTFPDATLMGQEEKFEKEYKEYKESGKKDILELADMFIVACGVARFPNGSGSAILCFVRTSNELEKSNFTGDELQEAVDKKMEINRQRKWNFENGVYQHKEE